jgi:hypothetical protein
MNEKKTEGLHKDLSAIIDYDDGTDPGSFLTAGYGVRGEGP